MLNQVNVSEIIIKKLSQEQQIPLHIVKAVIENQFRTAEKAIHTVNSIEIAGFGRFYFRKGRALIRISIYEQGIARYTKMLEDPTEELSEIRREGIVQRIEDLKKAIIYLKEKLDAFPKE